MRLGTCDGGSEGDEQAAGVLCFLAGARNRPLVGAGAIPVAALPHGIFVLRLTKGDGVFCQEINEIDRISADLY